MKTTNNSFLWREGPGRIDWPAFSRAQGGSSTAAASLNRQRQRGRNPGIVLEGSLHYVADPKALAVPAQKPPSRRKT